MLLDSEVPACTSWFYNHQYQSDVVYLWTAKRTRAIIDDIRDESLTRLDVEVMKLI